MFPYRIIILISTIQCLTLAKQDYVGTVFCNYTRGNQRNAGTSGKHTGGRIATLKNLCGQNRTISNAERESEYGCRLHFLKQDAGQIF